MPTQVSSTLIRTGKHKNNPQYNYAMLEGKSWSNFYNVSISVSKIVLHLQIIWIKYNKVLSACN